MGWANSGSLGRGKPFATASGDIDARDRAPLLVKPVNTTYAIAWHDFAEKHPKAKGPSMSLSDSIRVVDNAE